MAQPVRRGNRDWEGNEAIMSLAGVRPLVQDTVAVSAGSDASYTITHSVTKRLVVFHASGVDTDIRIDVEGTATATDMPVVSGAYFVVEAVEGEDVSFYNTSGTPITVNVMEIT